MFVFILIQVVNDTALPNTVQFNVTVAAVTPSAVYNVTVSAGSTMFTITGTDSITGPTPVTNNPDFIITNMALFTWKQPALSLYNML